jgi:hypothetical protein
MGNNDHSTRRIVRNVACKAAIPLALALLLALLVPWPCWSPGQRPPTPTAG